MGWEGVSYERVAMLQNRKSSITPSASILLLTVQRCTAKDAMFVVFGTRSANLYMGPKVHLIPERVGLMGQILGSLEVNGPMDTSKSSMT